MDGVAYANGAAEREREGSGERKGGDEHGATERGTAAGAGGMTSWC